MEGCHWMELNNKEIIVYVTGRTNDNLDGNTMV